MTLIPRYVALMLLGIGAWFVTAGSWFAVVFTGFYPGHRECLTTWSA